LLIASKTSTMICTDQSLQYWVCEGGERTRINELSCNHIQALQALFILSFLLLLLIKEQEAQKRITVEILCLLANARIPPDSDGGPSE
jgi:hypothetical protein